MSLQILKSSIDTLFGYFLVEYIRTSVVIPGGLDWITVQFVLSLHRYFCIRIIVVGNILDIGFFCNERINSGYGSSLLSVVEELL